MTEGIIDHLRSVEGAKVAALIRDQGTRGRAGAQGQPSLQRRRHRRLGDRPRARRRRPQAGGRLLDRPRVRRAGRLALRRGRRPARRVMRAWPPAAVRCCSATSRRGSPRTTWSRGCGASAGARPVTPAPSTPSRPGCCSCCSAGRPGYSASSPGCRRPTCRDRAARLALEHGDPDGELSESGRMPASLELPTGEVRQRVPMTSAVRVGGERLYRKAHRGEVVETPERDVDIYRAELLEAGDGQRAVMRSNARPAPTSARWSRPSATPTARSCAARRSAPSRSRTRARSWISTGSAPWSRPPARRCDSGQLMAQIKVTSLPDAEPRASSRRDRDLRRGPSRPPGGDRRRRHRPHLRSAPTRDPAPRGAAEADHALRGQA